MRRLRHGFPQVERRAREHHAAAEHPAFERDRLDGHRPQRGQAVDGDAADHLVPPAAHADRELHVLDPVLVLHAHDESLGVAELVEGPASEHAAEVLGRQQRGHQQVRFARPLADGHRHRLDPLGRRGHDVALASLKPEGNARDGDGVAVEPAREPQRPKARPDARVDSRREIDEPMLRKGGPGHPLLVGDGILDRHQRRAAGEADVVNPRAAVRRVGLHLDGHLGDLEGLAQRRDVHVPRPVVLELVERQQIRRLPRHAAGLAADPHEVVAVPRDVLGAVADRHVAGRGEVNGLLEPPRPLHPPAARRHRHHHGAPVRRQGGGRVGIAQPGRPLLPVLG